MARGFDSMKVHLIQFDIIWEDRVANHALVKKLLAQSPPEEGALLVLPEMFSSGFSMTAEKTVQGDSREDETFLAELAAGCEGLALGGVVSPTGKDGRARNEAVAVDAEGRVLARYGKQQLFTPDGEDGAYEAGNQAVVFSWQGVALAPLVCYDLRFPEHFRRAADLGAQVLVVIASWPSRRQLHWELLLRARAIENQAYAIGVNRCGRDPNGVYAGGSMVVDPRGRVMAMAGSDACVLSAELDLEDLALYRKEFPALRDRKAGDAQ